jgi:hypothetical protein
VALWLFDGEITANAGQIKEIFSLETEILKKRMGIYLQSTKHL